MYLKSLTLKGFKSFASSTTLQLEPGRYVLLSNLPAQYESGMFRPITVQ